MQNAFGYKVNNVSLQVEQFRSPGRLHLKEQSEKKKRLLKWYTLNWHGIPGGLNPVTGSKWLTDTVHHHLAIAMTSNDLH